MVAVNGAHLKVVVQKVSMAALFFASVMAVVSGARWPNVPKVQEVELVFVSGTVVEKDVNTKGVGKVHKVEQIFVKRTVVVNGARGSRLNRFWVNL